MYQVVNLLGKTLGEEFFSHDSDTLAYQQKNSKNSQKVTISGNLSSREIVFVTLDIFFSHYSLKSNFLSQNSIFETNHFWMFMTFCAKIERKIVGKYPIIEF